MINSTVALGLGHSRARHCWVLCHGLALKLPFQLLLQGGFHRSIERCDKLWDFPGLQNGEVMKWDLKASWPHSQCYCPTIPTPNPAMGLRDVVCSLTVVPEYIGAGPRASRFTLSLGLLSSLMGTPPQFTYSLVSK